MEFGPKKIYRAIDLFDFKRFFKYSGPQCGSVCVYRSESSATQAPKD